MTGAVAAAAACTTGPGPVIVRDLTAPFQTSSLQYTFANMGDQRQLRIPVDFRNVRSNAVRLDGCATVLERRTGSEWARIQGLPCPQAATSATDSIRPGELVRFEHVVYASQVPDGFPRLPEPISGVYRIVFGLRERLMPGPDFVVWQAVADRNARRSNEFAAVLPR
jgi:hypothetical protein